MRKVGQSIETVLRWLRATRPVDREADLRSWRKIGGPGGINERVTLRDQVARAEYRRRFPHLDGPTIADHFARFSQGGESTLRRSERISFANVSDAYRASDSALGVILPACVAVAECQRRRHAEAMNLYRDAPQARAQERSGLRSAKAIVASLVALPTMSAPKCGGGEADRLRRALEQGAAALAKARPDAASGPDGRDHAGQQHDRAALMLQGERLLVLGLAFVAMCTSGSAAF